MADLVAAEQVAAADNRPRMVLVDPEYQEALEV